MTQKIDGRTCHFRSFGSSGPVLFYPIAHWNRDTVEQTAQRIHALAPEYPFLLAAFEVDWNRELSPWSAPAAFGKEDFAGEGESLRRWLTESLIPYIKEQFGRGLDLSQRMIGGYSLAGLFSLWAFYTSGAFGGIASCSGSLWFPDWESFAQTQTPPQNSIVYLSLGTKEEKTRNPIMRRVGDMTQNEAERLHNHPMVRESVLKWNPGGHFQEPDERTAKGFAWLLNHQN